jgi:hypothetical protein
MGRDFWKDTFHEKEHIRSKLSSVFFWSDVLEDNASIVLQCGTCREWLTLGSPETCPVLCEEDLQKFMEEKIGDVLA